MIPDVFVTLVASRNPRYAPAAAFAAIVGAVLGGMVLYGLATAFPAAVSEALRWVPLVFPSMFDAVSDGLSAQGWAAMVEGASRGIPYKLFAAEAGARHLPFAAFVGWSVVARSYRIALSASVATGAGAFLRRKLGWSESAVFRTWAAVWIATYAAYAFLVIRSYA